MAGKGLGCIGGGAVWPAIIAPTLAPAVVLVKAEDSHEHASPPICGQTFLRKMAERLCCERFITGCLLDHCG